MDQESECPLLGIVDDDEGIRLALDSLMRSVGYRTVLFDSAESALASGNIHEADCLIVDYNMPGSGGLHLQRTLAGMSHFTPVIIVSAF